MNEARRIFEDAYDRWADDIWRHILFRIFSNGRAEELTQEAFLKFWEYLEKGETVQNPRALLYRIADHLIIDEKRKRRPESLDRMMEEQDFEVSYAGEKAIEAGALCSQIFEHVKTLGEEERRLFLLRYVDDLDPREIAAADERTPGSVSVALNRILKKIRMKFHES